MNLTREEFCLFNSASRVKFLEKDGRCVDARNVGKDYSLFLFYIYSFYVEMLVDDRTKDILNIEPVRNKEALTLYRERPD
jgi:hypothetical protein